MNLHWISPDNESMKQAYGAALRLCNVTASVNQMWLELCSCHSTLCLYGLWQAVTLVSPCCHTCCKSHYPLEMLFRIKNLCWRHLTAGSAGQTECESECFHATGGSLPSFRRKSSQQGCLQTDRALTQSLITLITHLLSWTRWSRLSIVLYGLTILVTQFLQEEVEELLKVKSEYH